MLIMEFIDIKGLDQMDLMRIHIFFLIFDLAFLFRM